MSSFDIRPYPIPPLPERAWELTATELARATSTALDRVADGERAVVTRRGLPRAILIGVEELMALLVREQFDVPPTEREIFAELVGDELRRRVLGSSLSAGGHGREPPRYRARGMIGAERTRRRVQAKRREET